MESWVLRLTFPLIGNVFLFLPDLTRPGSARQPFLRGGGAAGGEERVGPPRRARPPSINSWQIVAGKRRGRGAVMYKGAKAGQRNGGEFIQDRRQGTGARTLPDGRRGGVCQ